MVRPGGRGCGGWAGRARLGAARRRRAAGLVAALGLVADEAHEVGEEGELLAHQRAVDAVLAGDLAEQAAQLGASARAPRGRPRA